MYMYMYVCIHTHTHTHIHTYTHTHTLVGEPVPLYFRYLYFYTHTYVHTHTHTHTHTHVPGRVEVQGQAAVLERAGQDVLLYYPYTRGLLKIGLETSSWVEHCLLNLSLELPTEHGQALTQQGVAAEILQSQRPYTFTI